MRLRDRDPAPPTLALVAAVALHEAAAAHAPGVKLRIKWPNDLLADGAKLAGILLERIEETVAIGFGVNLAAHPTDVERPATSLAALTGAPPDAGAFLDDLAEGFARWLALWRGSGLAVIRAAWLEAAHPTGTALAARTADGALVEGLFEGLDEDGGLRLRRADGTIQIIRAGDVFLV